MTDTIIADFTATHPALSMIALFGICVVIAIAFDRLFQMGPRGIAYVPDPTPEEAAETERVLKSVARGDFQCSDRDLSTVVVPFRRTADAIADRAVSSVASDAVVGNGRLPHADWSHRS